MFILKALNRVLHCVIVLSMVFALIFSGYVLWSNHRTYTEAENVYEELLDLKPIESADGTVDFSKLKAINPDVCAWVTLDGTKIDYPIVQGRNNYAYLNRDFYGNFSLAGSIFLDTRNNNDMKDSYSLVYGHHMDNNLMFGDLDLYKDKEFFQTNHSATIVTETDILKMSVLAVLEIPDSSEEIFNPSLWGSDLSGLAYYVQNNAMYIWDSAMNEILLNPNTTQAVGLATCSTGATGTRTVIILIAHRDDPNPNTPGGNNTDDSSSQFNPPPRTGDSIFNSPVLWTLILTVSAIMLILTVVVAFVKKKDD